MTIYLDAVWMLNFFLDWMILMLTHSFAKASNHRARLMFGAIVASLLVPLTIFYPTSLWATPIGKALFSLIIVYTAFGFKNIRLYTRQLLLFYFISFALGGGLFGIYYLLNEQIHVSNGMVVTYQTGFGDSVSWLFVLVGFPIIWWFTKQRMDNLVVQQMKYDEMVPITICMHNQINNSRALIDSGNQLVDPITKHPVVICDSTFMKKWFSNEEWLMLKDVQENMTLEQLPEKWMDKFRIIPYQGVGGTGNFLLVLKPDWIQLTVQEQELTITRALIGLQFGELSPDGSYHCLMHPHLLKSLAVHSA
ncbi:sigma-E processing peptidase SpoIIGA [Pontibacillus yanchengensis]|uniref:Sporulation sigma-E factor-processing peptidase n=1 Tax=Pontibacillus yanchengensis Y32 TaxID=1385514 RepID=A0A0A2T9F6_9BACI|nr:sigma-E processing peptidase SpoIIGA [Pontibacillus yanchengensis]KGP72422.1 peptidase [Pontibacillus yanchengensis Y32]